MRPSRYSSQSGGGGGGALPPAPEAGDVLTSTAAGPVPPNAAWLPPGGFQILSFTGIARTVRRGATVATPPWAATFNTPPDAQSLTWTNPSGSQTLTPNTLSGNVPQSFTSNANNATSIVTLHASKGAVSKTLAQTMTWASSVLDNPNGVDLATVALTAAWINANLTRETLETTTAGSFAVAPTGSNVWVVTTPTAFGAGVWRAAGFIQTPTFLGTVAAWTNANGVVESQDLYAFSSAAETYVWSAT